MRKYTLAIFIILLIFLISTLYYVYMQKDDGYAKFQKQASNIQKLESYIQEKNINESKDLLDIISKELNSTSYEDYLLLYQSKLNYYEEEYHNALSNLERYEEFFKENSGNKKIKNLINKERDMILQKGLILSKLLRFQESQKNLEKIINDVNTVDDMKYLAKYTYSYNLVQLGEYQKSIALLIELSKDNKLSNELKTFTLHLLSVIYKDYLNDYTNSLKFYKKLYELTKKPSDLLKIIELNLLIENNSEALELTYNTSLNNDNTTRYISYVYQGILLYKKGDYKKSLFSFVNARDISEKIEYDEEYQTFKHINKLYLLYIYYELREYHLAKILIEEIKQGSFPEDIQKVAFKYEDEISRAIIIEERLNTSTK